MDDLKLLKHPTRKGKNEGDWYGDIWVTGNTSYLIMAGKSLVRLAEAVGETEMAARRKPFIDKAVKAKRDYMWDEKAGTFLSVKKETMEKIPVVTINGYKEIAAVIADKTVANAIKNGISEHYDSVSGQPPGNRDYCMSSSLATMMLDGLTKKYELKIKKHSLVGA